MVTVVYEKCSQVMRLSLWKSLEDLADFIQKLGLIGGDYNLTINEEEKLRELPVTIVETEVFRHCINVCNLEDHDFIESKYA